MWKSTSLITRWSLVQVQLAPLFPHILLSRFLSITQMLRKPHFTQFLRNRPQTTSAIQSNTSFYRPIFLKSFPTSPFFRGNSGNSGNAIPFHFIFSRLTVHLTVPIPINRPWDRWERRKILFIGKSRPNHAKNSQIFLELRNKCVKTAYLIAHTCLQADILIDIRRIAHPLFWFFAICASVLYFILEVIWERSAR